MIGNLTQDQFTAVLHKHLSPTAPIQSQEHLFGRERQIRSIQQALSAPGRSIFIYGDRGVGKTSLAQTVAGLHQAASHHPVLLACEPTSTFQGLLDDVFGALAAGRVARPDANYSAKFSAMGVTVELDRKKVLGEAKANRVLGLNEIVNKLIHESRLRNNEETVVVIDEFDRLAVDRERTRFADFIKQLGDQRVPIRFIFCGVAESLQTLLGTHASCYRYLEGVELKTLSWGARYDIIDAASAALGVKFGDRPRFRIAAISDGFPYYVHRLCEHLLWQMFDDPLPRETPTMDHYREAVSQAVRGIEQHLRHAYERATMKNVSGYEEVLWAMADHADFLRHIDSIRESYLHLFEGAAENDFLTRSAMLGRLSALKGDQCGKILGSNKKGWYFFRENIVRGYVRLRAEERGYELALDYAAATVSRRGLEWGPRNTRRASAASRGREWEPDIS